MALTQSLGRFIADLSPNRLPEEAAGIARMGFIDTIGTMIASSGADMITGYVSGYGTWAELFRRDTGLLHRKCWHPTDCLDAGQSPIPADVLFKRLSAIQSLTARDVTAPAVRQ